MSGKNHADEGVPVRLDGAPDHREAGVPVAVPQDVSEQESKSTAKSAAPKKEQ